MPPEQDDNPNASSSSTSSRLQFQREKHIRYLLRCLQLLPTPYQHEDCSRMSLAFFVLSSLDLLGALNDTVSDSERQSYIDWIYDQQDSVHGGFRGGPFVGLPADSPEPPHLAMTYTAILCLAILRDDFQRLDFPALLAFVTSCQTHSGSFSPYPGSDEEDVRFVYCALVICSVFQAFDQIDVSKAVAYLLSCRSYDHAFGQRPGLEGQGGTTYCAIASLALAGQLDALPCHHSTLDWLLQRLTPLDPSDLDEDDYDSSDADLKLYQSIRDESTAVYGFQGRPEKSPDACYSFWIGASIKLLTVDNSLSIDISAGQGFLLMCQSKLGGFGKFPDEYPDVYHTYLALGALALSGQSGLKALDPTMNVSKDSMEYLIKAIGRSPT